MARLLNAPLRRWRWSPGSPRGNYIWSLLLVGVATLLCELLRDLVTPTNLIMIYLLDVIIAGVYLGRGPSVVASVLSVLAFDFFLVPPRLTLAVSDTQYLLTFVGLLAVGLVISQLTARVREQAEAARRRAAETATLYALSRDLAAAGDLSGILQTIGDNISHIFGREVSILLPAARGSTELKPVWQTAHFDPADLAMEVANWAFQHGEPAGRGTLHMPEAGVRYLPLKTAGGTMGVLGVKPPLPDAQLTPEQRRLLEACASLAALAIERAELAESARQAQVLQAAEQLQRALLNSVSHDLRTPLVSITGTLSSLIDDSAPMAAATRRSLIETALEEAERLNRLVGDLLDISRIEAGALRVTREPCDVQDVIGAALQWLTPRLRDRPVNVVIPTDLPLVPMDFVLMQQVLINLIENAVKYSPDGVAIDIQAWLEQDEVRLEVADRGPGIPADDLVRVFDKFYRIRRSDGATGTGLGLAICKGIVDAHGGRIWAQQRPGGGTIISVALPVAAPEPGREGAVGE